MCMFLDSITRFLFLFLVPDPDQTPAWQFLGKVCVNSLRTQKKGKVNIMFKWPTPDVHCGENSVLVL